MLGYSPSMEDFEGATNGLGRRSSVEGCRGKYVGNYLDGRFG